MAGSPGDDPHSALVDQLVEEMTDAWQHGQRPKADDYLARLPALRHEDAVRLVYEEACLRQEAGEEGVSDEVLSRFPQYRSQLELLLDCNRLLRTAATIDFPEVGDDLGDFRLLAEIGRGAVGRTYLASQHSLAHRLMVLKVAPLGQEEHLSLARLQHMHIVPLYFEQALPDRGLRVLGMPYLGGATLSRVLDALRDVPASQRTAGQLLDALDRSTLALPTEYPTVGPLRKSLAQWTYIEAICWLVACLADALQYAHDRGLIHLDVKPSNVLIAGDGQPMLLDFHLAQAPIEPGKPVPDRLGGTPGHLSPEQQAAMSAIREGRRPRVIVDGRSDLYSLGLLLGEALGGDPCAGLTDAPGSLERCNPRVSPGLSDIVRKCLARHPSARYRDAASLADDLRRHLNALPLRGVANRSLSERWRKWRRRHPAALAGGVLRAGTVALVLTMIVGGFWLHFQQDRRIDDALILGQERLHNQDYDGAVRALEDGLEQARHLDATDVRRQAFEATLRRVVRAKKAAELHELVNRLRFRSGLSTLSAGESRSLLVLGLKLWNSRDVLLRRHGEAPANAATEAQIRTDLLDLATVWADLRVHRDPEGENAGALRDAVEVLRAAEEQFGPSPALNRDLQSYARALGRSSDVPAVEIPAPRTAWEHYELGRSYLRSNQPELALREFQRAVDMKPDEFWPYFSLATCALELGRYQEAVSALTVCVALFPRTAECYYNRAVAYEALDQQDRAAADYSRALELNPALTDAAVNRGVLALLAGRPAEAASDFRIAQRASSAVDQGSADLDAALQKLENDDWPAARTLLRRASDSGDPTARRLTARLKLE